MMIVDGCEGRPCADLWQLLVSFVTSLRASHSPTRLTCVQAIQVLARNPLVRSSPSGPWWRGGRAPFSTNHAMPHQQANKRKRAHGQLISFSPPSKRAFPGRKIKKRKERRQAAAAALFLVHYPLSILLSPLPSFPLAFL